MRGARWSRTFALAAMLGAIGFTELHGGAAGKPNARPPFDRFLLVSSEGLYIVEANGTCSWSYHPAPRGQQVRGLEDDIIYDGWTLPGNHYLFSTHRYIREIDREQRTVWEYRLAAPAEVKSGVPIPGGVAALNSQEQSVVELESGSGKVLRRIPVPARGSDHTRYMLLRRTPEGNYLVALREEQRLVEVSAAGKLLHSFAVPGLPVMAQRLADGSTICTGRFGMVKLDPAWKQTWSFTAADAAPSFPLLIAWGVTEMADGRLVVANSDWHLATKDANRVQLFTVDDRSNVSWTLPVSALTWKRSEVEPRTGFTEHRSISIQPLAAAK